MVALARFWDAVEGFVPEYGILSSAPLIKIRDFNPVHLGRSVTKKEGKGHEGNGRSGLPTNKLIALIGHLALSLCEAG
jgi:hypothetical protein